MPSWSAQSQFYWLFKIHRPQYFILKRRRWPKLLPVSAAVKGEGSVLSWLGYVEHSHHDLHAVRSSLSCYLCDPDRLDAGLSMHVDFGLCGKTLLPLRGLPAVNLTSCAPQESLAFYHPRLTSEIDRAGLRPNVRSNISTVNALYCNVLHFFCILLNINSIYISRNLLVLAAPACNSVGYSLGLTFKTLN